MTEKTKWKTEAHSLFGGECEVYTTNQSNGVFQIGVWVKVEGKMYRKSLRTKHLETALAKAQDEYVSIRSKVNQGKQIFSEDITTVVARYLMHRENDVKTALITKQRLGTIRSHLKNMLSYLHGDMKVSDIDKGSFKEYYNFRAKQTDYQVNQETVRQECSTIGMLWKWLYSEGLTTISSDKLEFQRFNRKNVQKDVRRDTFTDEEWKRFHQAMRSYASKKNCKNEEEYYNRQIIRNYVLILANTGMRTGELDQIRWEDLSDYKRIIHEGVASSIVKIRVRWDTSKVRKDRELFCRESVYFERLSEISKYKAARDMIFTAFKGNQITSRQKSLFWKEVISLAKVKTTDRKLSFYSIRHYFVTQRWKAGVQLRDIANSCGTSVNQIEKTYYHIDEEKMIETAVMDKRRTRIRADR
jgi:integrase